MLSRPIRTLVALAASLGLLAAVSAMPAAATSCVATSDAAATGDPSLAFEGAFTCTDAPDTGTWSITVDVTNQTDGEVTISALDLAQVTPSVAADAAAAAAVTSTSLPLTLAAGASGSFDVAGDYTLAQVGSAALLNAHLAVSGSSEGGPISLAITVHLLGPGAELDEAEAEARAGVATGAEVGAGQPEWVPGPPAWVVELIANAHAGLTWGTPDFAASFGGAAAAAADAATDATTGAEGGAGAAAGAGAVAAGESAGPPAQAGAGATGGASVGGSAGSGAGSDAGSDAEAGATVGISAGASGQVIVSPFGGE